MKNIFSLFALFLSVHTLTAQHYNQTLIDIRKGQAGSRPNTLHEHNGKLFFYATDSAHGEELRYYDESAGQAVLVKDIQQTSFSFPTPLASGSMASINGVLYFTAIDTTYGKELWMYDGNSDPVMIKDIYPGKNSSTPNQLTVLNNKLYFSATDPTTPKGSELFVYDPSKKTVAKLTDLGKYTTYSNIGLINTHADRLVFTCNNSHLGDELYLYDPKINLAWVLANIAKDDLSSNPMHFTSLNGKLYFTANDASNGRQIYEYDGINIPQRATALDSQNIHQVAYGKTMISYDNKLYFSKLASSSSNIFELYAYNPEDKSVNKIATANDFTNPITDLTTFDGKLYFVSDTRRTLTNVWMYNGTDEPKPISAFDNLRNNVHDLTIIDGDIYFVASGQLGQELYQLKPIATSVRSKAENTAFLIYPNPAKDVAHIQFSLNESQTLNITLTDIQGRIVYQTGNVLYSASKHTVEIPLHTLPNGIYILYVLGNTYKVIKQ